MSVAENVVPFPSADVWDGSGRPPEQLVEWTEQVGFTPFIAVGVDKLSGSETYVVWQEVMQNVDTVLAPSRDVACALLSHLYTELYYSEALDNIGVDVVDLPVVEYSFRQLLKRMKPFQSILQESGWRHIDTLIDYRAHDAAMEVYAEKCRVEDAEFAKHIAQLEAEGMPECAPV